MKAERAVPQQSKPQLGTKREGEKVSPGEKAKSPTPRKPDLLTATRYLFLSTPDGGPPRPIKLSERAYNWLNQRGLVKNRPPVATTETSSPST